MIKYFCLFCIALLSSCENSLWDSASRSMDFYVFEAKNGFEVLYDSGATRSIWEYYKTGTVVFNGSYFWLTNSWVYYPAGYWEIDKKIGIIPSIWKQFMPLYDDPNITHFVWVFGSEVRIFENIKFKENAGPYDIAFQAWPLVLSGGFLQNFWNSWHANEPHERTLLGKTQSGKIYFFSFIKPITLNEVWNRVIKDSRFMYDPITLLNLDGWPSTVYFDGKSWFRYDKKLPIIFRIHL